jgi:hypothetical protein
MLQRNQRRYHVKNIQGNGNIGEMRETMKDEEAMEEITLSILQCSGACHWTKGIERIVNNPTCI